MILNFLCALLTAKNDTIICVQLHSSQDVFIVGAEFFSFALGAVGASPDAVELFYDFADKNFIVGNNAGFEVSFVLALCAHAGTGEIGAAGIGKCPVNNYGFEMDSRA